MLSIECNVDTRLDSMIQKAINTPLSVITIGDVFHKINSVIYKHMFDSIAMFNEYYI